LITEDDKPKLDTIREVYQEFSFTSYIDCCIYILVRISKSKS